MKKIVLSILFLSLFLTSCESDDDGITYTTPDYLSGKWAFSEIGVINDQNFVIYQDYSNEVNCEADNLVLGIDSSFVLSDFSTVSSNCQNNQTSGEYVRENKNLILFYSESGINYEKVYTIVALSYTEITVSTANSSGETIFYKLTKV
jgi:hypothetical protein